MRTYHVLRHLFASEIAHYPEVDTFVDLPGALEYIGEIYVVLTATGIWGINRKRTGLYRSDGSTWMRLGKAPLFRDLSIAPSGKHRIANIYYDSITDEQVVERLDTPEP